MDHREAKRLLLDFVTGDLDQRSRSDVTSHIEECVDCRAWLKAHDLLAAAAEENPTGEHPDSELLSLCAVRPGEEDEPGELEVRQHIEDCESCRREMDLVRSALLEARSENADSVRTRHPIPLYPWWRVAAAAFVVAVAVKVFLPVETRHPEDVDLGQNESAATMDEVSRFQPGSPGAIISDEEIEGVRLIEADGSLTLSQVKIKDGARVTIRAGDVVAFGNGFQVGPEAQMTVTASVGISVRE